MEKYKYYLDTNQADLNLYECGTQVCPPGHANGPLMRQYYLLHFVRAGKGIFRTGDTTYHLTRGDAFLICPGRLSFYCSDFSDPWVYSWLAMDGIKVEEYLKQAGLSHKSPVYTAKKAAPVEDALLAMVDYTRTPSYSELRLMGLLYLFLSALADNCIHKPASPLSVKEDYLQKLVRYVSVNLWDRITVTDMANYVGLDRSYLYRICKERLKLSPQEFVLKMKLEHACDLLRSTNMPIGDVARSVGYDDQLAFSRLFRRRYGVPPREYRHLQSTL